MSDKKCDEDLFCGINTAKSGNPDEMSDLEKKHTPVIESSGTGDQLDVSVKCGHLLAHPNEHGHFIQWVELYAGETFIGRVDYASERAEPSALFKVNLSHKHPLKAIAHCNLHGTWSSTKDL